MSREADLVSLISTANEIYLVNPANNARSAYIQIDDLCELILKSYLQANVKDWSPYDERGKNKEHFKGFWPVSREVKDYQPGNQPLADLLARIESRRTNRNQFFHNHEMSGLTITDEHCLQSFCDLYDLLDTLFPNAFRNHEQRRGRAQVAAIRALKNCAQSPHLKQKYNAIVSRWKNEETTRTLKTTGEVRVTFPNLAYDYCVIHYYPDQFYDALQQAGLI
jgi:hypothetical protein